MLKTWALCDMLTSQLNVGFIIAHEFVRRIATSGSLTAATNKTHFVLLYVTTCTTMCEHEQIWLEFDGACCSVASSERRQLLSHLVQLAGASTPRQSFRPPAPTALPPTRSSLAYFIRA